MANENTVYVLVKTTVRDYCAVPEEVLVERILGVYRTEAKAQEARDDLVERRVIRYRDEMEIMEETVKE